MSSALSPAAQISKLGLTAVVIFIFFQGCLTIVAYQFFVNTIYHANAVEKQLHLNRSKKSFILLLVTILSIVAPSYVRITTENATIPKGTFRKNKKQRIVSSLKKRSVFISNHQIYTDWVFLWWLSYTSELAGNVIIMLKKSLESLPILGYGMKNYNFIFMNRKWELDRVTMTNVLQGLDLDARGIGKLSGKAPSGYTAEGTEKFNDVPVIEGGEWQVKWPYSLILFPEGTNMSRVTRIKSERYAERVGRKPLKHVLLPHTTGLRFALQKLARSCEQVYDITVGYSGTTSDTFGEEMYNLRNVFLRGKAPALVDIHIRAFTLCDIPYNDEKAFEEWMHRIWEEKDRLMDIYYKHGSFDLDPELNHTVTGLCQVAPGEVAIILTVPLITSFLTSVMLTKLALFYFGR